MSFRINDPRQIPGWRLVFAGRILLNETGRKRKAGGIAVFVIIPTLGNVI